MRYRLYTRGYLVQPYVKVISVSYNSSEYLDRIRSHKNKQTTIKTKFQLLSFENFQALKYFPNVFQNFYKLKLVNKKIVKFRIKRITNRPTKSTTEKTKDKRKTFTYTNHKSLQDRKRNVKERRRKVYTQIHWLHLYTHTQTKTKKNQSVNERTSTTNDFQKAIYFDFY